MLEFPDLNPFFPHLLAPLPLLVASISHLAYMRAGCATNLILVASHSVISYRDYIADVQVTCRKTGLPELSPRRRARFFIRQVYKPWIT